MDWISVEERIPETPDKGFGCKSDRVLVYLADQDEGYRIHFARCILFEDGDVDWMIVGHSGSWKVTHWMPLPDCPTSYGVVPFEKSDLDNETALRHKRGFESIRSALRDLNDIGPLETEEQMDGYLNSVPPSLRPKIKCLFTEIEEALTSWEHV